MDNLFQTIGTICKKKTKYYYQIQSVNTEETIKELLNF